LSAPAAGGARQTGEVLTSRTVRDLSAGSGLIFDDLGAHQLEGLTEDTTIYRVRSAASK
jgi:class 3 adenylate cyclase